VGVNIEQGISNFEGWSSLCSTGERRKCGGVSAESSREGEQVSSGGWSFSFLDSSPEDGVEYSF